jgi:uncharacterized protein
MSKKGIPTRDECILLLKKLGVDERIIEHTKAVSRVALEIAKGIKKNGVNVDTKLVEAGGLLHDIGRSKVHGLEHGVAGGTILRELGYSDSLARIADTHVLCGVVDEDPNQEGEAEAKDHTPRSLEEKIVCYADKITVEKKRTTLERRFDKWFQQYGRTPFLERAYSRSKGIETELNSLLSKKK